MTYINTINFCGSRPNCERATQVLLRRFHRDHQFAVELNHRGATKIQDAMIADSEGQKDAAKVYYLDGINLVERLVEQWEIVIKSVEALTSYISGNLREDFIQLTTSLDLKSIQVSNTTSMYTESFDRIQNILSRGGEAAVTGLLDESKSQFQTLHDMAKEMLELLRSNLNLIEEGKFYDTIVTYSLLADKKKHPIMDLDERLFTVMTNNELYLESVSSVTREVALQSKIPYEDCTFIGRFGDAPS